MAQPDSKRMVNDMQAFMQHLLAEGDIPTFPIVLAIAFVVWVVGSIASSVKKVNAQQQKLRKEQSTAPRGPVVLPALKQTHPNWAGPKPAQKKQPKRRPPPVPKKVTAAPAREPAPILMSLANSPIVTGRNLPAGDPVRNRRVAPSLAYPQDLAPAVHPHRNPPAPAGTARGALKPGLQEGLIGKAMNDARGGSRAP